MNLSNRMIAAVLIVSAIAVPCALWATARTFSAQGAAFSSIGFVAARVTQISALLGTLQALPPDVRDIELAKTDFKSLDDLREQTQSAIKDVKRASSEAVDATERVRIVVIVDSLVVVFASLASMYAANALRTTRLTPLDEQA